MTLFKSCHNAEHNSTLHKNVGSQTGEVNIRSRVFIFHKVSTMPQRTSLTFWGFRFTPGTLGMLSEMLSSCCVYKQTSDKKRFIL